MEHLQDVCLDCCDFLHHLCVECDDCPVHRLTIRYRNKKGVKFISIKEVRDIQ